MMGLTSKILGAFVLSRVNRQSASSSLLRSLTVLGGIENKPNVDHAQRQYPRFMSQRPPNENAEVKMKVLYDGDCPLCMQEMKIVEYANKKKNVLELVNIASPDYLPEGNNNISYETAMDVMHVIGPDQQVYTGVDAMYQMYSALGMRWAVAYMRWPVLASLFDKAYMAFARNRLGWTSGWRGCKDEKCQTPKDPSTKDS